MRIYKCKLFIQAGSSSASIDRLPIVQYPFSHSEHRVNPHMWPSLYLYLYFPGRVAFLNNIVRPPFAYNAFFTQSRSLGASQFVGFNNLCTTRPLSDYSNSQKHGTAREISGQNRLRNINKNRENNPNFSLIPGWVRWLFGALMTFWGWHMVSDLLKIEGEVKKVVEIVEDTAETAEKMATMTEEICNDIVEEFPQEGGINTAVHFVEHLSEEVIQGAHNTLEFIHKMTSTEKIVETSIETAVEAIEELINAKPAISKSKFNEDDKVTNIDTGKTES